MMVGARCADSSKKETKEEKEEAERTEAATKPRVVKLLLPTSHLGESGGFLWPLS